MSEWHIGILNGTKEFVFRTQQQQLPIVSNSTAGKVPCRVPSLPIPTCVSVTG